MIEAAVKLLLAYLLGNLMGGQIVGRLRGGVDLRSFGSGNVGATNALRTQGKGFALAVLLIDVLKGAFAATVIPLLPWPFAGGHVASLEQLRFLCGVGVAVGHCYPLTLGFRGGKGVATLAGVFGALMLGVLGWMLLVFALVVLINGYVSAATIGASAMAVFCVLVVQRHDIASAPVAFTLAMALLVLFKHRHNLKRLWRGDEHRFERARLIGRWIDRYEQRRQRRRRRP